MDEKVQVHNIKRIIKCTHPFSCQYFNTFKMQNFTPESFHPGVFHSNGIRSITWCQGRRKRGEGGPPDFGKSENSGASARALHY